jgi:hypothetical protein
MYSASYSATGPSSSVPYPLCVRRRRWSVARSCWRFALLGVPPDPEIFSKHRGDPLDTAALVLATVLASARLDRIDGELGAAGRRPSTAHARRIVSDARRRLMSGMLLSMVG